MKRLPISPMYDRAIYEAVAIQSLLGVFAAMMMGGEFIAQILGIALIGFWGGAVVLMWRNPQTPSRLDLECIRVGYLVLICVSAIESGLVWRLRGALRECGLTMRCSERPFRGPIDGWTFSWAQGAPYQRAQGRR